MGAMQDMPVDMPVTFSAYMRVHKECLCTCQHVLSLEDGVAQVKLLVWVKLRAPEDGNHRHLTTLTTAPYKSAIDGSKH
eukprot:793706-Pelagomonas_calceolata.AAC.5